MKYKKDEITVILTTWKRNYLLQQLQRLSMQTKKPYLVWVYQNESHLQIPKEFRKRSDVSLIQSHDINFKFHGRFMLTLLCDTEYVAIFDDDTMPGRKWLENCLDTSKRNNCIVGANGRIMKQGFEDQDKEYSIGLGDGKPIEEEREVDFVGHCWFFKSEWCKYLWMDRPHTWDNGEDIHLAASSQIHGDIKCYIPKQPNNDREMWGDLEIHLGSDSHASWKKTDHSLLRGGVIKHWHSKGWRPLTMRS